MSPFHIALVVAVLATHSAAVYIGARLAKATELEKQQFAQTMLERSELAAAEAIAQIKPVYKIIHSKVEKEISENTIYHDCLHSPDGLRLVNQALTAGGGKLPGVDAARE